VQSWRRQGWQANPAYSAIDATQHNPLSLP